MRHLGRIEKKKSLVPSNYFPMNLPGAGQFEGKRKAGVPPLNNHCPHQSPSLYPSTINFYCPAATKIRLQKTCKSFLVTKRDN